MSYYVYMLKSQGVKSITYVGYTKIIKEGKAIVNGWLQIPNSFSAEVMANQGWDSLTIDMQHGVVDLSLIHI